MQEIFPFVSPKSTESAPLNFRGVFGRSGAEVLLALVYKTSADSKISSVFLRYHPSLRYKRSGQLPTSEQSVSTTLLL